MKKPDRKFVLKRLKEYLMVTLAGVLNAISLFTFVNPSNLIAGGFSGLSSAVAHVFGTILPNFTFDQIYYVIYIIFNIPLLICSVIMLRGDFTFKTIWATVVCTVVLAILPKWFPYLHFTESKLITVIFGGVIIGFSMYVAYKYNGSNGGTEIIARIVSNRKPEIDISTVLLYVNMVITLIGTIVVMVIKGESVSVVIYSFVYVFFGAYMLGLFQRGFNHPQKFLIITNKHKEIGAEITRQFARGYSVTDVKGGAPNSSSRKMIVVVVQYRQMHRLKQIIYQQDPQAFTFVKDVNDVFSRPLFNRSYKTK